APLTHITLPLVPTSSSLSFLSQPYLHPPALPSFPTRRSSDLDPLVAELFGRAVAAVVQAGDRRLDGVAHRALGRAVDAVALIPRSEEHTSELQSLTNLVCRLLLEKKNRISKESDAQRHVTRVR